MRISNLLMVFCVYYALLGCSSIHTAYSTNKTPAPPQSKQKNPMEVSFYSEGKNPVTPYTIIGEAKVSNYNKVGIKRQDAVIHDAMRTLAASMGGDAIIAIKRTNQFVIGNVITYQPKTVV